MAHRHSAANPEMKKANEASGRIIGGGDLWQLALMIPEHRLLS